MSTNQAKPTPGPWQYSFEGSDPSWAIVTGQGGAIIANVNSETGPDAVSAPAMRQMPADANARLIAEVGTVYHETGLTPRELAEQREELRNACLAYLRHVNTTDGVACNRDVWRMMKAALAQTAPQ
ncbi:MAG: hypothetical protein QM570_03000 [Planctomycetota bacterium]|nr:hypothetical protein [Planctomycetota bacterium]